MLIYSVLSGMDLHYLGYFILLIMTSSYYPPILKMKLRTVIELHQMPNSKLGGNLSKLFGVMYHKVKPLMQMNVVLYV